MISPAASMLRYAAWRYNNDMPASRATLCFGGTFDPIHLGHLRCARAAADDAGFDRILLIPSARPPHKPDHRGASPADRLAMCHIAAGETPGFDVSNIEINRPGPSYTIDTARQLRAAGMEEIFWLIGADTVPQLSSWHNPEALASEITFIVMQRPSHPIDWQSISPLFGSLKSNVVQTAPINISATRIRQLATEGRSLANQVTPGVAEYIAKRHLYQERKSDSDAN